MLLLGTGLGSAFALFSVYKRSSPATFKDVLRHVIFADILFTSPAVFIQLITGIFLAKEINLLWTTWFWIVLFMSFFVFILWVIAFIVQKKMDALLASSNSLSLQIHRLMKIWIYLGIPAFLASIYLLYLMVFKTLGI